MPAVNSEIIQKQTAATTHHGQTYLLRHHGRRHRQPLLAQKPPIQAQAILDILGTGKSFIRMTYERFEKLAPAENFLVVTNARYKDLVLEQIPELGPEQVLCEPVGRNTAPCICYAAYGLQKRDPGAKMIVTPADHLILNEEDFRAIIGECLDFIDDRAALMTVGIKPTRPETGYGYIQVSDDRTISKVKCFTEKPNLGGADVPAMRRISLELRHLRLESRRHHRSGAHLPARAPRPLLGHPAGIGHFRRSGSHRPSILRMPLHLDRLRRDGEGEQRLCTPRRVRLERRGDLGLALPARPQGPLRQRQTREGMLYGRKYPQLHRLPPGRQSSRHQRPEGVHRGGYGGRAADLSAQQEQNIKFIDEVKYNEGDKHI